MESSFDKSRSLLADALSKLASGKGNLVRKTDELRRLGAKAAKAIDPELLAQSREDDEGAEPAAAPPAPTLPPPAEPDS